MLVSPNSTVEFFDNYVIKEITNMEEDEPLELIAAREAYLAIMAKVCYPYVPKIYSVEGTKVKMERIYGTRLDHYLEVHPERLADIIERVKSIVKTLISGRVFHCDPAPRNLIIDEDDNIWIIDFGSGEPLHAKDNFDEWYQKSFWLFLDNLEIYSPLILKEIELLDLFKK